MRHNESPNRMPRRARWLAGVVAIATAAAGLAAEVGSHLIWNRTESLPRGLYWLHRGRQPRAPGELVAFPIPGSVRALVHERGYLPEDALIVKPVVAGPGDRVCV